MTAEERSRAFNEADEGFLQALEALGSIDEQFTALKDSHDELRRLILEQGADLRALRERLNGG